MRVLRESRGSAKSRRSVRLALGPAMPVAGLCRRVDPAAQFTVLLPVWRRDDPTLLVAALDSVVQNSCAPRRILICADGDLTPALEAVLARYPVDIAHNAGPNFGLHHNLNNALDQVTTPWIARADADDINLPERFACQVHAIAEDPSVDVIGTDLIEVAADGTEGLKHMPVTHENILRMARYRCPVNHNTVFVRTDALKQVGGYPDVPRREDYALWLRMLARGYRFGNVTKPLVRMTLGADFYVRRSGPSAVRSELMIGRLRRTLPGVGHLLSGFLTASRISAMVFGPQVIKPIYKAMRRRKPA